ncbi:deoxyguanosinetriphosphate triphosphohydrolase [Kiritimatiellota bacterium B12222]|nr:deoxyguanosinetriphosphate triphosphohydrolase [Kiritimatiellota bacterium B12222]
MIESRADREQLEEQTLAPYAAFSGRSRGRFYQESKASRRADFQRDCDRIINSRCFRRLEYKTQVFVIGTQDHYRTRLTHTMEMTQVARTLARALRVNEDLAAAISLAHDIGHSPFGHSGERALDKLMADHGGFDHNLQSLRWVEELEETYPEFNGLNLTWEVRAGLCKHLSKTPGVELDGHPLGPWQMVEGQIADVADDISYHAHDAEDGLDAGLITLDQLRELDIWRLAEKRVFDTIPNCDEQRLRYSTVRMMFTLQVEDVLTQAAERLNAWNPQHFKDVMDAPDRLVAFSPAFTDLLKPYRSFLFEKMYFHPEVANAGDHAVRLMTRLFEYYLAHPEDLGEKAKKRLESQGLHRTVCDYVAGCTDRYAFEECQKYQLTEPQV